MHQFHGDLLIGGMAIRNVDGLIEEHTSNDLEGNESPSIRIDSGDCEHPESHVWSGKLTIDRCQRDVLELGRQYLLLLDDGRNREVVLTEIHLDDSDQSFVCEFSDCAVDRAPK